MSFGLMTYGKGGESDPHFRGDRRVVRMALHQRVWPPYQGRIVYVNGITPENSAAYLRPVFQGTPFPGLVSATVYNGYIQLTDMTISRPAGQISEVRPPFLDIKVVKL